MNNRNQGIFFLFLVNNTFKQTWAIICSACLFLGICSWLLLGILMSGADGLWPRTLTSDSKIAGKDSLLWKHEFLDVSGYSYRSQHSICFAHCCKLSRKLTDTFSFLWSPSGPLDEHMIQY